MSKLNNSQKSAGVGSWLFNSLTQVIEWSDDTYDIWGFDIKDGAPNFDALVNRIHADDQSLFKRIIREAIQLAAPYDFKHRICLPNGEQKIIRAIGQPLLGHRGEVIGLSGTTQDITLQKQAIERTKKAEKMYRLLADSSDDLICLNEPDSTFKYISPSIKNILGYEQSDLLGKRVFHIVHKDDSELLKEGMKHGIFNTKVNEAYAIRVLHKVGHFIWLEFLSSAVYKEKEISYFIISAKDISQRVIATEKMQATLKNLAKSENSFEEISKLSKIAFWECDSITKTIICSEYFYDLFGLDLKGGLFSQEEILRFFSKESQRKIKKANLELNLKGVPYDLDLNLINFKKEELWVRNVVQPIYNDQREIIGRRGVFQNITESKKLQIELAFANKELIYQNKEKEKLAKELELFKLKIRRS